MLGGVHGDKLAERAGIDSGDHLAHQRHGAHDQADEDWRDGAAGKAAGQVERLRPRAHDRLLAEDRKAGREGGLEVRQMQVVGRADHDQVEGPVGEQRRLVHVGPARLDPVFGEDGKAHRRGVGVAGDLEQPADFDHGREHVGDALAKADDRDAMASHAGLVARANQAINRLA